MFFRRTPDSGERNGPSRLSALRDIVEIVAIIAAGGWAFYTFIYQNDIKPANSTPLVQFEAKMTRLGERHGFVAVQSHIEIKNVGISDVWFYGIAETVLGSTIRARPRSRPPALDPTALHAEIEPEWIDDAPIPVYSIAFVTQLANPRSDSQLSLSPGQSIPVDRLFYVRAGRYDELLLNIDLRFAAHEKRLRFTLAGSATSRESCRPNPPADRMKIRARRPRFRSGNAAQSRECGEVAPAAPNIPLSCRAQVAIGPPNSLFSEAADDGWNGQRGALVAGA